VDGDSPWIFKTQMFFTSGIRELHYCGTQLWTTVIVNQISRV